MKRINNKGYLITIGSFDGVHLGHASLLNRTVFEADKRRLTPMALTFVRPPKIILKNEHLATVLSTPLEKEWLIRNHGFKKVYFLKFDGELAKQKPFYFFKYVLLNEFHAKGLVVGFDFRFGSDRSGSALDLVRWGQEFKIPVWVIPQIKLRNEVVSSSLIRLKLLQGSFNQASRLLGHPYVLIGNPVKGNGIGAKIGFPTVNLKLPKEKILPRGVFAVSGFEFKPKKDGAISAIRPFHGVCNIGVRPTFFQKSQPTVEVHSIDRPLSGESSLLIKLEKWVRSEKKFDSPGTLIKQIERDTQTARSFFGKRSK